MKKIIILTFVCFFAALSFGIAAFLYLIKDLPDISSFDSRKISQSSKIYDRTGTVLLYEIHGEEKRTIIPFSEIPEKIKQATIAIEDSDFYHHAALDWRSMIRAFLVNLKNGKIVQGGSTITQQLAKNAFLTTERTIQRKLKEFALAFKLENKYTKDQILELYLNQIPYGANSYGVEAASKTYFGKSVKNLSLAELSVLASLPKAPSYYSPGGAHKDELLKRQKNILDKMASLGFISKEEADKAKKEVVVFLPQTTEIKAPHFVMTVIDYLNAAYGEEFVQTAGLKIITTLDWNLEQLAEKSVYEGAKRNEELYEGKNAALVAEDPTTGQILALAGSRDYFDKNIDGNFNVATQGLRQPGSTIKPFAYITAFKKGFTPDTVLFDLETEFETSDDPAKSYKPKNFDEIFRGPIKMKEGLAQSINIPSVKTLYLAGLDNVLKLAKSFGINTLTERSRYGLSLVLGGGEVKLIEMVGAYSVFSQEGLRHAQSFILRIEDSSGKFVEEYTNKKTEVIEGQYARLINNILSDIELRRPLFQKSLELTTVPNHEIALKTGTTNDYRDAWAIGYTPSFVVGVWAGNNDNTPMVKKGSSILAAVPIWSAFIKEALKDKTLGEVFNQPDPINVEKPILHGEYVIDNQVHNILYYVDKNNPQGPNPIDPSVDYQFKNWEEPVEKWLETHPISSLQSLNNENLTVSAQNPIKIYILTPKNGGNISGNILISAKIASINDLKLVEIYLNKNKVEPKTAFTSKQDNIYTYQAEIDSKNTELQNNLKIKVVDVKENSSETEIILFK